MTVAFSAVTLGLLAALFWGSGDFIGGYLSRRMSALVVVFSIELVGILLLVAAALLTKEDPLQRADLLYSCAGGVVGVIGITVFYRGLATYPMGLMAPLTAILTALVPVFFGFILEGLPETLTLIGILMGLAAIWLISAGDRRGPGEPAAGLKMLLFPIVSGTAFGLFFILFDQVSVGAVYWPVVAARITSMTLIGGLLLLLPGAVRSAAGKFSLAVIGIVILGGLFDAGGNVFFILAAQSGRLDISSMLASLFPAATVGLAWLLLKERLGRRQMVGVVAALAAVVLIAA